MSNQITVSAPGKMIFFGEHAVVYNYPSLSFAVDKRVKVTVGLRDDDKLRVCAKDLQISGLDATLSYNNEKISLSPDYDQLANSLNFLNTLLSILREKYKLTNGFDINISSELVAGAGFGSSAAVTVSTTKAISELLGLGLTEKQIFDICFDAKRRIEGNCSGSDIAASLYGGIIKLNKNDIKVISRWELPVIVGYTGEPGKTASMISRVADLKKKNPPVVNSIFEMMKLIVEQAEKEIKACNLKGVGELMNLNQGLLDSLGVNTSKLSRLIYAARGAGALGAKISGAGGGKCMFAIAADENIPYIVNAINIAEGMPIPTRVSPQGVRIE